MNSQLFNALGFVTDRKSRVWQYVLFLSLLFVVELSLTIYTIRTWRIDSDTYYYVLGFQAVSHLFFVALLLFHVVFLIPKLLFQGRFLEYFLYAFLTISLTVIINERIETYFYTPFSLNPDYRYSFSCYFSSFIHYAFYHAMAASLKLFKLLLAENKKRQEAEQSNRQAELSALKSQLNPHFLFNTLNNLYVMNKMQHAETGDVILGLSDLLRYQVYETNCEEVALKKEIEFIENWLKIEKIRRDQSNIRLHVQGKIDDLEVPPFLFMPMIENAIKHGADECDIDIKFILNTKKIDFQIINTKCDKRSCDYKDGGVGLRNVKRRLELLFSERHSFEIKHDEEQFCVNMKLEL